MDVGRIKRVGVCLSVLAIVAGCTSGTGSTTSAETTVTSVPRETSTSQRSRTTTTLPATTTTTTELADNGGPPDPAPDPGGTGPIGVVGCSNTDLAVVGYTELSGVDRLLAGNLGGGSLPRWGDPSHDRYDYWPLYEQRRPDSGYTATWVQICMRTGEHKGSFDSEEQSWITHVIEMINSLDPGIPIWVSPINDYEGLVCEAIGPDGFAIAAETADWAAEQFTGVYRGPDLGPLTDDEIGVRDDCHQNSQGELLTGAQLVEFFD